MIGFLIIILPLALIVLIIAISTFGARKVFGLLLILAAFIMCVNYAVTPDIPYAPSVYLPEDVKALHEEAAKAARPNGSYVAVGAFLCLFLLWGFKNRNAKTNK